MISFLIAIIILPLYGLYGTTAALVGSALSKLASHLIHLHRPNEYLSSNEAHDACMLVGMHANCSTWHLYTGDRGVVDNLLNKPLIGHQPSPSSQHPFRSPDLPILLLRAGHITHFLAMTFTAAQKGWDGVAMVLLMLAAWLADRFHTTDAKIAEDWLDVSGVKVRARRFDFEGRMQMIVAIQFLSGSGRINWMDGIIVPHPRREALFRRLGVIIMRGRGLRKEEEEEEEEEGQGKSGDRGDDECDDEKRGVGGGGGLGSFDENWVALQAGLVVRAAEVMLEELGRA